MLRLPQLKSLRTALHPLVVEQQKKYALDAQPTRDRSRRKRKFVDKEAEERLAQMERNHINHVSNTLALLLLLLLLLLGCHYYWTLQTQMKAIRMKNLEKLNEDVGYAPRVSPNTL